MARKLIAALGLYLLTSISGNAETLLNQEGKIPALIGRKYYMNTVESMERDKYMHDLLSKCIEKPGGNSELVKYLMSEIQYLRNQNDVLMNEVLQKNPSISVEK